MACVCVCIKWRDRTTHKLNNSTTECNNENLKKIKNLTKTQQGRNHHAANTFEWFEHSEQMSDVERIKMTV